MSLTVTAGVLSQMYGCENPVKYTLLLITTVLNTPRRMRDSPVAKLERWAEVLMEFSRFNSALARVQIFPPATRLSQDLLKGFNDDRSHER
jgi:hypothetical protein